MPWRITKVNTDSRNLSFKQGNLTWIPRRENVADAQVHKAQRMAKRRATRIWEMGAKIQASVSELTKFADDTARLLEQSITRIELIRDAANRSIGANDSDSKYHKNECSLLGKPRNNTSFWERRRGPERDETQDKPQSVRETGLRETGDSSYN
eukprot:Protomagalhaensia_wolfi_Nauph_80__3734@NODE_3774_length_713_cov_12_796736_g2978_i0_p1_GENE_NODE_3774_length_713_cov_12_796736_g2978_i0NODE_3774_length_713_cov_12_796736_g2978_i0_p1_ORF_typecomplete_len153_score9_55_NODE_3774_length_713_cov_12_796736_g2978_i0181639